MEVPTADCSSIQGTVQNLTRREIFFSVCNADPYWFQCETGFQLFISTDQDPGSRINVDPDPDLGNTAIGKKHTYEGAKAFLKARKPGLLVNGSGSHFLFLIQIRIQEGQIKLTAISRTTYWFYR